MCVIEALQGKKDVFYVAPTFQQAKDVIWGVFKEIIPLGMGVATAYHENTGVITLVNNRRIHLKGSDRPDTLRGVGLQFVVIDEYASMKASVWEQILRPALSDVQGKMMAIGTPAGRNHFYDLFNLASDPENGDEWGAWHFTSYDNPFIKSSEIDAAKKTLSTYAFRQEYEASFEAASSDLFKPEWFTVDDNEPEDGDYVISVDLAGFENVLAEQANKRKHLDQTAIVVAKVNYRGWWVKEIIYGRWDIRETAVRVLKAARSVHCKTIGIEKGSLKNAITPYMQELQIRNGYFVRLVDTTHGNRKKTERIVWSLQGRLEHGRIKFNKGQWNNLLLDQMLQFPDPKTHDDLLDALSYVDQVAVFGPDDSRTEVEDNFEIYDPTVGY